MISFEEFKKVELRVGIIKSVAEKMVVVDFGEKGSIECKTGNSKLSENELVVGVLSNNGKAMLLASKAENGSFASLLTVEKPVKPGTLVE